MGRSSQARPGRRPPLATRDEVLIPVPIEIGSGNRSLLADRTTRTAIFAAGGGIIGLILGFLVGGRRQAA